MSNIFVLSFTHLNDKPHGDRALHMLKRIASLVKPIMRKHNWTLPVLAEFFPEQANLLGININAGQKICLRLRPPHDPGSFLDEAEVVQTMLHELTHNVHGPHDEAFYKFLSKLQDEYEALQRSGYAGEGFFTEGKRLGAGVSHNLSPHEARAKALAAAEKRAQTARVLGHGGRLGGRIEVKGLSPRELAAQAAERRARDEKACGSGALAEKEAEKAAKNSIENKVIDLTGESSDDSDVVEIVEERKVKSTPHNSAMKKAQTNHRPENPSTRASSSSLVPPPIASGLPVPQKNAIHEPWSCVVCTLINDAVAFRCNACSSPKPVEQQSQNGWTCLICGEHGMPDEWWTCSFCGTVKASS